MARLTKRALAFPPLVFVGMVGIAGVVGTGVAGAAGKGPRSTVGAEGGLPVASLPAQVEKYDPDNVTALSKFMENCIVGNNKYVGKDFAGAADSYRKAIKLAPKNALGPYLLAEALLAQGNVAEADASLKEAQENADDRSPAVRAKILFLVAELLERQKKWEQAHAAWDAYGEYVGKYHDAGAPLSAPARILALDEVTKQDKAYEVVRQRIAGEKDAGPSLDAALPKK